MRFKTLSADEAARLATLPLDHAWDSVLANGFLAAAAEEHPGLCSAVDPIGIHGLSDIVVAAAERSLARLGEHAPIDDGLLRLAAAWAATVDVRYACLAESNPAAPDDGDVWTRPAWFVRATLSYLHFFLEKGRTAKVRQLTVTALLTAEHLSGRDAAFTPWLTQLIEQKRASSPRRADEVDHAFVDRSRATPAALTAPDAVERLAGLDPTRNPYLRSAAAMAALGFVGEPYALR